MLALPPLPVSAQSSSGLDNAPPSRSSSSDLVLQASTKPPRAPHHRPSDQRTAAPVPIITTAIATTAATSSSSAPSSSSSSSSTTLLYPVYSDSGRMNLKPVSIHHHHHHFTGSFPASSSSSSDHHPPYQAFGATDRYLSAPTSSYPSGLLTMHATVDNGHPPHHRQGNPIQPCHAHPCHPQMTSSSSHPSTTFASHSYPTYHQYHPTVPIVPHHSHRQPQHHFVPAPPHSAVANPSSFPSTTGAYTQFTSLHSSLAISCTGAGRVGGYLPSPVTPSQGILHLPQPVEALDSEYSFERLRYLRNLEERRFDLNLHPNFQLPPPFAPLSQITSKIRKTLVLWLIEVHHDLRLTQETLYLAVNILDRVSGKRPIALSHYQLLGLTCLWLASKYEENHGRVPLLKNLVHLCCECYSKLEFKEMELCILKELSFDLSHPSPESFLRANHLVFMNHMSDTSITLARYIMELTLVHGRFAHLLPSLIAAASLLLSDEIINNKYTSFENKKLSECMDHLAHCLVSPPPQLVRKYSSRAYLNVSQIAQAWVEKARGATSHPALLHPTTSASADTPSLAAASSSLGLPSPPKEMSLLSMADQAMPLHDFGFQHLPPSQQQPPLASATSYPTPVLVPQSLEAKSLPPLPVSEEANTTAHLHQQQQHIINQQLHTFQHLQLSHGMPVEHGVAPLSHVSQSFMPSSWGSGYVSSSSGGGTSHAVGSADPTASFLV